MARDRGNHGHRHPGAAARLESLAEEGAATVRRHEGGHTRHWIEEVRSLNVVEDGPLPAPSRQGWRASWPRRCR